MIAQYVIHRQYSKDIVLQFRYIFCMAKFNVPKRHYCNGPKKMVSMRLHQKLIDEVEKHAKLKGWTSTDLVSTVLDQYLRYEDKKLS